jgi:hypothetical protein
VVYIEWIRRAHMVHVFVSYQLESEATHAHTHTHTHGWTDKQTMYQNIRVILVIVIGSRYVIRLLYYVELFKF